jgi:hemoglobin-like flavoprotein
MASVSYQRCCENPGFLEAFYRNFFTVCPEAAPRFANTDFERQNKLLRHAFGLLLIFPKQPDAEPTLLTRVAERHSRRDLNVPPSFYPPFVDSLIATVKQYDPACTQEVEEAWRRTVEQGVRYMVSKYESRP